MVAVCGVVLNSLRVTHASSLSYTIFWLTVVMTLGGG